MVSLRRQVKVVVVEDHTLFAEALVLALSFEGYDAHHVELPRGSLPDVGLIPLIMRTHPKIVLLDLDLGSHGSGMRLVTPLARAGLDLVVVTASGDEARWGHALYAGARTALSKSTALGEILGTVRRISRGFNVLDVHERERLIRAWASHEQHLAEIRRRLAQLSPRESQVLEQLMEGVTVGEIARLDIVSETTVRSQVKSILAKLEVSSQIAAVGLAHEAGWRAA